MYQLKANVMNVLSRMGVQLGGLLVADGKNDIFSKSLAITDRNGKVLVELGLVKKEILAGLDIFDDNCMTVVVAL